MTYIQLKTWTTFRENNSEYIHQGDVNSHGDHTYAIYLSKTDFVKLAHNSDLNEVIDDCNYHRREKFDGAGVPKSLHSIWVNLSDLKHGITHPRFALAQTDPSEEIAKQLAERRVSLIAEYQKIKEFGEF